MKYAIPLFLLLLSGCQGKLTEEQKAEMRKGIKAHEIKKITEAEITEAAFNLGRKISEEIDPGYLQFPDNDKIRQIESTYHVVVRPLQAGDSLLLGIERMIIDAYTSSDGTLKLTDNIQKLGTDSLLYTKPMVTEREDGPTTFNYALGIRMSTKQVILSTDNL